MNAITHSDGPGGLPFVTLRFGRAELTVCLQGGQITSYKPDGETELLWLSECANYVEGKSIRGGIPLCWPWFGPHPERADRPQHGFARVGGFQVAASDQDGVNTRIVLAWDGTTQFAEWRNRVTLQVEIRLSDNLWLETITTNTGDAPLMLGCALHTYFRVGDVRGVRVPELGGLTYLDKTRDYAPITSPEALSVRAETDRVYTNPPAAVTLEDPALRRRVLIESWGNTDLVVWNPWTETARAMADFDDAGYLSMLCIEPAQALANRVTLAAGAQMKLGKRIQLLSTSPADTA